MPSEPEPSTSSSPSAGFLHPEPPPPSSSAHHHVPAYHLGRKPSKPSATTTATMPPRDETDTPNRSPSHAATMRLVHQYRTEIAASTSSVLSTIVGFPVDSVKTRMQTYSYDGVMHCVRHTYQTEHLRGFFRGVMAPMASITLVRTVSISIYQRSKHVYSDWIRRSTGFDVMDHVSRAGTYPNLYSVACFGAAGATAGSCITFVACPFELTKLSAQVSTLLAEQGNVRPECRAIAESYQNKGTLKTMANIVRHRGYAGLYTGLSLHMLRDTVGTGIYFMVYESSKQLVNTVGGDHPHTNKLAVVASGGLCGIISWAMIYPIDSAKSRYQRNSLLYSRGEKAPPPPKIEFFKRHMYRGLGVSMGRSCLVNATFFSSYEFIKKHLQALDGVD